MHRGASPFLSHQQLTKRNPSSSHLGMDMVSWILDAHWEMWRPSSQIPFRLHSLLHLHVLRSRATSLLSITARIVTKPPLRVWGKLQQETPRCGFWIPDSGGRSREQFPPLPHSFCHNVDFLCGSKILFSFRSREGTA